MTPPRESRSVLERFLGLFTEMRPGEAPKTLLLTLNVFLLLMAYYLIKPVREALILAGGGAEIKSYASAAQVLLLAGAVPLYARLAGRYDRRRLITVVTVFFIACLLVFYALVLAGAPVGVVFYLWVGIFNLMVVAQFWSFANDVCSPDQGKRLFVIIAFGASAGAVFGSRVAGEMMALVGVAQLLLVSAVLLAAALLTTVAIDAREIRSPSRSAAAVAVAVQTPGRTSGFLLVLRNRYLLMIALMMMLANWVNTTGEYILGRMVVDAAADAVAAGTAGGLDTGAWIGRFYSDFFFGVNLLGLVLQLFVVSRILKYLGVRTALLVLPAIALLGNALVVLYPLLRYVRWTKTAENATDYSLQNTVRNILFLPVSREEKYNAKQAVDTFFVRAGDVLSALLVYVGAQQLAFGVRQFAAANLLLILVWLGLAVAIGRRHRHLAAAAAPAATAD